MIEWISHWLQNIILVVLLATFVDLLLPTTNMQKYSKMVLGLIVILSIISPIFSLFSKDFSTEIFFREVNKKVSSNANIPVMEEMTKNKDQLNEEFKRKLIQQVETAMKEHLISVIENRFNVTVHKVALKATIDEKQNWQIDQVEVSLLEGKRDHVDDQKKEIKEIEKVEIVTVNTDKSSNSSRSVEERGEESEVSNQQLTKEMVQVIKEQWGLKEEQITVKIEHDLS
ncbi:stage III sporulation protein AF [Tepidibacillus fermentans]|uniref:Stage III sporulation protein AF n=1 Tax=Tepidibacillus fermentans TaxID=1281767 RepID=A0A4R3KM70_9BACI|nr:stage III sporulation protein AF [Tepidibacillus fermentans]TCS84028.1 stage III sporulation protein AF [Tepidibacillus fermentans]